MRCTLLIFNLIILSFFSNAQQFEIVKDRTGKNLLKGFVTDSILSVDSISYNWYGEQKRLYVPQDEVIQSVEAAKDKVRFLVFFGTWCTDSHYVIPRFYKIIEQAGVDKKHITLFALDRTKKDDAHFASTMNVSHVPTIIVLTEGKEQGRVVEYGTTGKFDEELALIVTKAK